MSTQASIWPALVRLYFVLDARVGRLVGSCWIEDPSNSSENGSSSPLSKFGNSAVINRSCRSPDLDLALACLRFAGWPGLVEQSDQRLSFWNRGDYYSHSVDPKRGWGSVSAKGGGREDVSCTLTGTA